MSWFAIVVSLFALYISWRNWDEGRAIYELKKYKFPKNVGASKTENDKRHEAALYDELKSGRWAILHTYSYNKNELMILLGCIKQ